MCSEGSAAQSKAVSPTPLSASPYIPSVQDTIYPTTGGTSGSYRLLIQRPVSTGVFSGDFGNSTHGNSTSNSTVASLQPSFTGQYTNLEVVDVNATTSTGSTSLTPAQLCAYLKSQNPGECQPFLSHKS